MPTHRLYHAIKNKLDKEAVLVAARYNGAFGPPKRIPHDSPLLLEVKKANNELTAAMCEAKSIVEEPDPRLRAVKIRIAGERDVASFLVASLIQQGCEVGGDDGERRIKYGDMTALYQSLFDVDIFWLNIRKGGVEGAVTLIFGNSPAELMADWHLSVTEFVIPTQKYIKKVYDPTYIIDGE